MPGRLRYHAAALLVLLVALLPVARWQEVFQADEAVALAQAEALLDGDGWRLPNPSPELDPTASALPLENVDVYEDGSWAPFAKHPAYPILLAGSMAIVGDAGPLLLSVSGTFGASVLAALVARRLRPGSEVVALWVTGLASPLLFDAYLVIAHAVGAAVAGVLAFFTVDAVQRDRQSSVRLATLASAALGLQLLRTEAIILVLAMAAALVGFALTRRRPDVLLAAAAVGTGGSVGYGLDRLAGRIVVGDAQRYFSVAGGSGGSGWVQDRIDAARVSLVDTTFFDSPGGAGLALGTVLFAAGAILARSTTTTRYATPAFVAGCVAIALRLASTDDPVPGLLVSFPILLVGVLSLRDDDAPPAAVVLGAGAAVFVAGVLLAQYANAGGGGWGGRYFAIGLPLVTPLAAVGLVSLVDRVGSSSTKRLVVGSVSAATAVLAIVAVASLHRGRLATGDLVDRVVAARVDGAPVMTTSPSLGRFAWQESLQGGWLSTTPGGLPELSARVAALEGEAVFVTRNGHEELPIVERDWDVASSELVGRSTVVARLVAER